MQMMPSVAPLVLEGNGFTSTLHLVNDSSVSLETHIQLLSITGKQVAESIVTMKGFSSKIIAVRDLLSAKNADLDLGSLRVFSNPSNDGLLAALAVSYAGGHREVLFDEELPMPTMEGSSVLRGVSDDGMDSIIAITSLSDDV